MAISSMYEKLTKIFSKLDMMNGNYGPRIRVKELIPLESIILYD